MEILADHPEGLGLVDLAGRLHVPVNSVLRIALTLCTLGFAQRDPTSRRFSLTHRLLTIGYRGLGESNLLDRALDVMRELRDRLKETVLIGVPSGDGVVCLEQAPSLHPFKFTVDPGLHAPFHSNAPGKAIWAFLPRGRRDALLAGLPLPAVTPRTITDRALMARELERVRRRRYATDRGENLEGCHCVGSPILDHRGEPVAAIWITGPAERLPETLFRRVGPVVAEHAARVSRRLGGRP